MVKRDLLRKNIICILIAVLIFVFSAPLMGNYAYASGTTYKYDTGKELSKITSKALDIIAAKKYKAVHKSNGWYYQFTKGDDKVLIKIKALQNGSATNKNTKALNKKLTEGIMGGSEKSFKYIYKTKSSKKNNHNFHEINWDFTRLSFSGQRSGNFITLQANDSTSLRLHYNEKIRVDKGGYDYPGNAGEYKRALTIWDGSNNISPKFEVIVKKPGTNKVRLDKFSYEGKGKLTEDDDKDIAKSVKIAYLIGKVAAEYKTSTLKYSDLYELYGTTVDFVKGGSREYSCRKFYFLTRNDDNCLKYTFKPPVQLQKENDYSQISLYLNKRPSSSSAKVPTDISVTVTF